MRYFAERNLKEMLRDKLNLAFGLGFPIIVLLLLTLIQSNIPVSMFELDSLTPGIAVFGLSFISLFSGMLLARDRCESFLMRLYSSPLKSSDYMIGYILPIFPLGIGQIICCFAVAVLLGLDISINILVCIAVNIPAVILFESFGLLCGSIFTDKQVGGICGALLTNLSAWLSGTWFSLDLLGGTFKKIAMLLPFANAVEAGRAALEGSWSEIMGYLWIVLLYAVIVLVCAIIVFKRKMHSEHK